MKLKKLFIIVFFSMPAISGIWANSSYTEENLPDYPDLIIDAVTTTLDLFTKTPLKKIKVSEDSNFLSVKANIQSAQVYLNREYKGTTPVKINNLAPGNYTLTLEKKGYKTISETIQVKNGIGVEYSYTMLNITGRLEFIGLPSDSLVYIDGKTIKDKISEIEEGKHSLKVKCFGYSELNAEILIQRYYLKKITVKLEECDFRLTDFRASKESFNPNYRSFLGEITFTSEVTAKGSGFLEILNSNEEVIYRKDVPGFYTWTYQYTWNGKDSHGMTVTDGLYIARFTAEDQVRELAFKVDRSIFYHLTDLTGAGTGIGNLPMAISMPEKSAVFDISVSPVWETGTGFYSLPLSFGLRAWPVKGFELSGKFTAFCCQDEKLTAVTGSEDEESQTSVVLSGCAKFTGETGYYLKFTYGACIHYGYCNIDNLNPPFDSSYGSGLGFAGMAGLKTDMLFTGLSSEFIFGSGAHKLSDGENTWRNGIALSITPNPEVCINLSCALNSNSDPFDSIEPEIGISALLPGLPLMIKISGRADVYFKKASYFSTSAGFSYLF